MPHHPQRFSRDPAQPSAILREKLAAFHSALRNSIGVTPTTRRKTLAKWLGLV